MSLPAFTYTIELLNTGHNRVDFRCGIEALDRYLREQAGQDLRRYVATPFVLCDVDANMIAGYYTLAATSIQVEDLPKVLRGKLPRYPLVPATLLGRLAIDERYQGQGLGAFLLVDALRRSFMSEIAAMAVVVDAKDEQVRAFYEHHGFTAFPGQFRRLYLPMTLIARQFS
ncbi:GCN5 family acetyltransferase [Nostoc piscinale CENA21]|uniref:GCN5 family acetyltransferase n=1 Tax=Nostoc piscinale CENA21 TaxID=224013 RepID=A0A0M4TT63_9NOSO|nr:GNAT family N-acetyltransferase [Nostoc piscinale]ALF51626.1 GCN5 family acetyltransferase [Nostoc piscinale CENA21]